MPKAANYPLTCAQCGCDFMGLSRQQRSHDQGRQVFCGWECAHNSRKIDRRPSLPCGFCGKTFVLESNIRVRLAAHAKGAPVYCCVEHMHEHRRARPAPSAILADCEICGKRFTTQTNGRRGRTRTCSRPCAHKLRVRTITQRYPGGCDQPKAKKLLNSGCPWENNQIRHIERQVAVW